jgi:type II pantothenate kinase
MGQTHVVTSAKQRPEDQYHDFSTEQLQGLAVARNLAVTRRQGLLQADRATLLSLLRAYDTGLQAGSRDCSPACSEPSEPSSGPRKLNYGESTFEQEVLDAPGPKGVDIGGTLVKVVLALPKRYNERFVIPDTFGATGRTRPDLEFDFQLGRGTGYRLKFISGGTAQIEQAITNIKKEREKMNQEAAMTRDASYRPANMQDPELRLLEKEPDTGCSDGYPKLDDQGESELHLLSPPQSSAASTASSPPGSPSRLLDSRCGAKAVRSTFRSSTGLKERQRLGVVLPAISRETKILHTAGGGAHKFAALFQETLKVTLQPVKELQAVVDGLLFINAYSQLTSLFTLDNDNQPTYLAWPEPLFPFILVNVGSGVSILRVDSAKQDDYVRVGGTACGGSTFLGLTRALTSARTFGEALKLAAAGDAKKCDLLVQDIYGEEGSASLGLAGSLTAANFGRLCETPGDSQDLCSENDIARSILQMVTQQSVLLSSAYAKQAGCVDRVFFVGGFVEEENHLSRVAIANNFRSLGGCAYFLQHSDYLGALGSLRACMRAEGASPRCG